MIRICSLIFVIALISCGASRTDETTIHNNWPGRSTLFHNFREAEQYILVYNKSDYAVAEKLQGAIQAAAELSDRVKVVLKRDDEITEEELKSYPIYIAGTATNLLIKRLDGTIPVDILPNGFEFDKQDYTEKSDILKISFYPNPFNPELPITVILGNEQNAVAEFIGQELLESWGGFFWDNWGYQVIQENKRIVIGNFSEDTTMLWSIDKKVHWEFNYAGELVAAQPFIKVYDHQSENPEKEMYSYALKLQLTIENISNFAGRPMEDQFDVHVYPTVESIALAHDIACQTFCNADKKIIYSVINNEYKDISNGYEFIPAVRSLFGNSGLNAMEKGLAVYFTTNWQGKGYGYWANKLVDADVLPGLNELLDNELYESNSPLIIDCMAAMFIEFIVETKGKDYLLTNYSSFENKSGELLAMEVEWNKYLKSSFNDPPPVENKIVFHDQFLKGFNFAHEGYEVYNGYMGTLAMQSLEKLKSIGANSITIIPYSGFRSMNDPHPFRLSQSAGAENDAAVIRSAYKAEELGFVVIMKPQIWSWLGWTGDITMKDEAQWNLFFEYYDEWIMHYALLAEIHHVEIFCVGNEFKNATLTHQQKWEELFAKVRKVYSGKITYAANWGAEFEQVTFWNDLDYIAVNCYYPLSSKTDPTDEELMQQMERNLDLIESVQKKYNKPLLFTEIGFKSISSPWISPHKDDDEQGYNEASQRRCYDIMFKAMEDEDWINGVYIWKWPSYMDFSKEYEKDFNPCGKEAEATIADWFGKR